MKQHSEEQIRLAEHWPIERVEAAVRARNREALVEFLRCRYEERFLTPIRVLSQVSCLTGQTFGFAIMALCSLMVETIECYCLGLPFTGKDKKLWKAAYDDRPDLPKIDEEERKNEDEVYEKFFKDGLFRAHFQDSEGHGPDGKDFCRYIRNGLLHQAQTNGGWRIKTGEAKLWDKKSRVVDRDMFANGLRAAFQSYLEKLGNSKFEDKIWKMTLRKTQFLVELSKP